MMRGVASRAACVGVLLLICARQTLSAPELQPALLTNPTAQSISELQRAVRDALNGAPVRLAGDALTQNSILVVERVQPRDAAGLPLNGRELGKPEWSEDERFATNRARLNNKTTLVVLMGLKRSAGLATILIERGWAPATPLAVIFEAGKNYPSPNTCTSG